MVWRSSFGIGKTDYLAGCTSQWIVATARVRLAVVSRSMVWQTVAERAAGHRIIDTHAPPKGQTGVLAPEKKSRRESPCLRMAECDRDEQAC